MFRCYSKKTGRCCECNDRASKGIYCERYVTETQQTTNTETIYGILWEKGDHPREKKIGNGIGN